MVTQRFVSDLFVVNCSQQECSHVERGLRWQAALSKGGKHGNQGICCLS